jgi:signal transduction histidine kinase
VFARRPKGDGPTVAVVVDLSIMLERSKLARGADAKLYVASADGTVAPISNLTSIADPALRALAESARAGMAMTTIVPAELARSLGLPDTTAVAFSAPLVVDEGAPWTLLAVTSTSALENQEKTLVRRVTVGGALVLVLLLSAAAYVVYNTRRTATLEERLRHVQEQRRFEERMVHSEKLATAGQLAAGIAHEIGTPLNVARGRVELVLSHLGAQHAEAKNHEIVIDQIDRVTRLIQQLLDYVRPRGAVTQQLELGAAMRTVAELLGPQATKRGVRLSVEADKPVAIEADPDQIQQVLVNLVLNALDACEKGGAVTMRAHEREIEVIDDGAGIPRELQAQIFDPFFTTKKRGQGTGLGLWVVAQLVHAQHGEIDLDSAPGKGTTVRVRWPA